MDVVVLVPSVSLGQCQPNDTEELSVLQWIPTFTVQPVGADDSQTLGVPGWVVLWQTIHACATTNGLQPMLPHLVVLLTKQVRCPCE